MSDLIDEAVTQVLTRCLTEVVEHRPQDPIDYIAHCLYRHADCEMEYHNKRITLTEMELFKLQLMEEEELRMDRLSEIRQSIRELKEQLQQETLTRQRFVTEKAQKTKKTPSEHDHVSLLSDAKSKDATEQGETSNSRDDSNGSVADHRQIKTNKIQENP